MIEMSTMIVVYAVQIAATAFLALLLASFHRAYGHSYLREWSWSWLALCGYVTGALIGSLWTRELAPAHPIRLGATMLTLAAGYTHIAFLLFGTFAVARGRPVPTRRRQGILALCLVAAVALALPFTADPAWFSERFFVRVGLRSLAAGVAYLIAGLWLARHAGWRRGYGRAIVLGAFLLYGAEQLNYFTVNVLELVGWRGIGEGLAWLGFLDLLLQFGMGMGMVIWLLEDERDELGRTAEALRRSEERLRRSQRLEQVGQLAGGVAHDFNNLLTVIIGRGQRLMERLERSSDARHEVAQIDQAAARGAALVQQLLAFSRKQMLAPQCVQANETARQVRGMLRRVIGEHIRFRLRLADDLGWTMVDPVQLEQVLINLVLNARDAMPDGGTLTLTTRNVTVEGDELDSLLGPGPGDYVEIMVGDTGVGMDDETRRHAFEPFFTTKEVGQGSGLGMATVWGVVRQSGGAVEIDSAVGEGTMVRVYLPRVAAGDVDGRAAHEHDPVAAAPATATATALRSRSRRATILVVEDDERIRGLLTAVLRDNGYDALIAEDGAAALELARGKGKTIDLLLTDVVMPRIDGPELADRLQQVYPDLRVLFMSGYSEEIVANSIDRGERALLEKPFSLPDLLERLSQTLEG